MLDAHTPESARAAPPRRAAVYALLRDAARLDRTQSDPRVSLRNAVGVAAPLAIGVLAGNVAIGVLPTIGALQTAFADRPGPYRLRTLRILVTALATAVTSGLAVVLSGSAGGSAALLLVIGFAAGLLIAAGPSAAQVGIATTGVALILGYHPTPAAVAFHVGLLVFAGGALQAVLAIAAWPLGRHRPERLALARLYRELAGLAREPPGEQTGPPLGDTLAAVRATLYGLGHDHGPSVEAYRVLLDEADRIRRELIVLAGLADRLARRDRPDLAAAIRAILPASAEAMDEIAAALDSGRPVDEASIVAVRARTRAATAVLDDAGLAGRAAAARARSLAGQLRAAITTSSAGASEGRREEEPDQVRGVARLRDPIAVLRANLTPASAVFRHAVRAAVLVAGSDFVVRLAGYQHGYWVPLTVMVTLRPDFATTLQRSFMRVIGTIVGLLLATVLVHWIPGGPWWSVALVALFFFGMRLAGPGNLGLTAVSLSGLVVVLLALSGVPPHTTIAQRTAATAAGGGLALLATLVWPVWARAYVPDRIADLLEAYREYLARLVDRDSSEAAVERARAAARLARSNAQAAVDTARADPVRSTAVVDIAEAVLAHTHRFIHAMLTIDAVRDALPARAEAPELDELLARSDQVLASCADAVRSGQPPRGGLRLRPVQEALMQSIRADPDRYGGSDAAGAVLDASDRIANSLDTLVSELRRQLGPAAQLA